MKGLQDISFENEAKIRKAILSLSIATIILSNVELHSNTLDFFGLKVIVSLDRICATLKFFIILLLFGLSLTVAERLPRMLARTLRFRDEKWWSEILPEIEAFHNQHRPRTEQDDYDEFRRDNLDWDDELYSEKYERSMKRLKVLSYFRPIAVLSRTITQYVLPVGMAALALLFPQAILMFS